LAARGRLVIFNFSSLCISNFNLFFLTRRCRAPLSCGVAGLRFLSLLRHANASLSLVTRMAAILVSARLRFVARERRRVCPAAIHLLPARVRLKRKAEAECEYREDFRRNFAQHLKSPFKINPPRSDTRRKRRGNVAQGLRLRVWRQFTKITTRLHVLASRAQVLL
jgi:hypothetical protein